MTSAIVAARARDRFGNQKSRVIETFSSRGATTAPGASHVE
jgi:hypothetical protein